MSSSTPKVKYRGGHYCCVTGCNSRQGRDEVKFFNFSKKNKEQCQLWINAVKRENFVPKRNTVICQLHFVDGKPESRRDSPNYVPTLFPTQHCKPKTEADLARFERVIIKETPVFRNSVTVSYFF